MSPSALTAALKGRLALALAMICFEDWADVMDSIAMMSVRMANTRISAPSPEEYSQGGPVATREQQSHAAAEHAAPPHNVASRHRRR